MKITSVKVHRLVSGPGYNNQAVSAEAEIEDGEDPVSAHDALVGWVDARLKTITEADNLSQRTADLSYQIKNLERTAESLKEQIKSGLAVIKSHTELADLAEKNGIKYKGELGDILPF